MRLFVAIALPPEVKCALAAFQRIFHLPGIRASWTRPESMHLTLKFLGETPQNRIEDIAHALRGAVEGIVPFQISVAGIGTFPQKHNPRVLWCGIQHGGDQLVRLAATIDKALADIGFPHEERSFTPHLTLARIQGPVQQHVWSDAVNAAGLLSQPQFMVSSIVLMSSELRQSGAKHTEVARLSFASSILV